MTSVESSEHFDGILVVGAGLVGCLAAIALVQQGYPVKLVDFRSDFRHQEGVKYDELIPKEKSPVKRSINLALSHRGQEALKHVGLLDEAMKLCIPMYGRAIHLLKKDIDDAFFADDLQLYDENDPKKNHNNSISREYLNRLLLAKLDDLKVSLKNDKIFEVLFETKLQKMEGDFSCVLENKNKKRVKLTPKFILGCDGAYSSVRNYILRANYANFQQIYIPHGYKEFTIDPLMKDGESSYKLPQHEYLHIWPRGDFMLIGLPNLDKSFTGTLFAPMHALDLGTDAEIENYFNEHFPDVIQLIPDYVHQYRANPASRLVSVKIDDWAHLRVVGSDNEALGAMVIGDAAHACVPFYGQGMNCGFEDVLELSHLISAKLKQFTTTPMLSSKWVALREAVKEFDATRVKDAQACATLSYTNYKEMRSHTASKLYVFQKHLESFLNRILGDRFIPLYKMVTFTRIPYSQVITRNEKQQRWLKIGVISALLGITSIGIGATIGALHLQGCEPCKNNGNISKQTCCGGCTSLSAKP